VGAAAWEPHKGLRAGGGAVPCAIPRPCFILFGQPIRSALLECPHYSCERIWIKTLLYNDGCVADLNLKGAIQNGRFARPQLQPPSLPRGLRVLFPELTFRM
jgi:hypothetical protein